MKRNLYSLALFCFLLLCASCQKEDQEGIFNPKKQLSKITAEIEGTLNGQPIHINAENELTFYWKGKRLEKVGYYEGTEDEYMVTYSYDKKGRVSSMEDNRQGDKCVFTYDGNFISEIKLFRGQFLTAQLNLEHSGNKISKIHQIFYEEDAYASKSAMKPFSLIMDRDIANRIYNDIKVNFQSQSKGIRESYNVVFSWNNDNISNIDVTSENNSFKVNIGFEYDNMTNPFFGFNDLSTVDLGPDFITAYSHNNITSYQYTANDETTIINYQYTYEGNYPITRAEEITDGSDIVTQTNTYYYK